MIKTLKQPKNKKPERATNRWQNMRSNKAEVYHAGTLIVFKGNEVRELDKRIKIEHPSISLINT